MKVNTDELERQAAELQNVASRINDIQDSVLRIARNLAREQFGERFRYPLNNAAASIGKRSDEMKRMRTALRQIAQLYERTEGRIVDEAEHASVHHPQNGVGAIPIPGINIANPIDRNYPVRPVEGYDGIRMPLAIPIALPMILRELVGDTFPHDRMLPALDRAVDALEDAFEDQYGAVWISESSARRMEMRGILFDMMDTMREGATPDLDAVADEIARIARGSLQDVFEGARDDVTIIDGRPDVPRVDQIPEGMADAIRDALYQDGESGYVPPHFRDGDIPVLDPSTIFEGSSISDGISGGAADIASFIAGEAQINENIFQPLGPGGQAPSAADVIRNAADVAADAIASAADGLTGIPIASLDPVGPGIANQIIGSIDGAISSIADAVPDMGGAIAGGVGNIDWTPWNP